MMNNFFKSSHSVLIAVICSITILTFGNTIQNTFVGDDDIVIANNTFYRTLNNLPRLFQASYFTDSDKALAGGVNDYGSGSVGYRPVLSLSYFLDYAVWSDSPHGYHVTNLILHCLISIFLYLCVFFITRSSEVAFWSSILFSVHPLRVEAVNSIGYRADLLSTLFLLVSFYSQLKAWLIQRRPWLVYALLSFLLALFSKETAVMWPIMLLIFCCCYPKRVPYVNGFYQRTLPVYVFLTGLFLYLYFIVFHNATLQNALPLANGIWARLVASSLIFGHYVLDSIWPWGVDILPPMFTPHLELISFNDFAIFGCAGLYVVFTLIVLFQKRPQAFWLSWFFIFLLPVLQIVPIATPMAHRFVYLPSIGLITACMCLIFLTKSALLLKRMMIIIICISCMVWTIRLNVFWKNNYTMAKRMVQVYPNRPEGYLHLGIEQFQQREYNLVKPTLLEAMKRNVEDPRLYYLLAVVSTGSDQQAYFKRCTQLFPKYAMCFTGLARSFIFNKEYDNAIDLFEYALGLNPTYTNFGYLIQGYLLTHQPQQAEKILNASMNFIIDPAQQQSLHRFFEEQYRLQMPIDIGI